MKGYEKIEVANKLFQWDNISDEHRPFAVGRIFHEGECTLHSYGRGFYYVKIYVTPYMKWNTKTKKYDQNGNYSVRVWYATIDDGDFGGWYDDLPLEDAKYIANEIKNIYDPIISLPSDEEMNELLEHTGITVGHE